MKKLALILSVSGMVSFFSVGTLLAAEGSSQEATGSLGEISEKQDRILQMLEDLKSELQIVKIRVSSR